MFKDKSQGTIRIAVSLLLMSSFYLQNPTFAEETVIPQLTSDSTSISSVEEVNSEENQIKIADASKTVQDKNIVPVLDLKGGVKATEEQPSLLKTWLEGDKATGDWGGLRSKLEEHGVTIEGTYYNGNWLNLRGGASSETNLRSLGVIDTSVSLDTEKMGLWSGGKFVTRFQNKHGMGSTKDSVGDFQLLDTYDVHRFGHISEYYYQHSLFDDKFSMKVGKQEANFDFCALSSGFNFANASFSFMPTIPLPSYPNPAMGLSAKIQPTSWLSFKSGWYDGEAAGGQTGFQALDARRKSFFIEELGIQPNIKDHKGNYFIGYYLHTGHSDEVTAADDPRTFAQTNGWYMGAEQMVLKENKDADDTQGLTLLGQLGWKPHDRSEVSRYWSLGTQYQGLIPGRDNDLIGMATANAGFSSRLKGIEDDGRYGAESVLEFYYKVQLTPWLAIQPDMQVIMHPNGQEKSAFVMGLRTFITF
jgi:porin